MMRRGTNYKEIPVNFDTHSDGRSQRLEAQWDFSGSKIKGSVSWTEAQHWAETGKHWAIEGLPPMRDIGAAGCSVNIDPKGIGKEICGALFEQGMGDRDAPMTYWNQVYLQAPEDGAFRIVFNFQVDNPDLRDLPWWQIPWETWWAGNPATVRGVQDSFALAAPVSMVRRIHGAPNLAPADLRVDQLPLRILLFAPEPADLPPNMVLDTMGEISTIKAAVGTSGKRAVITVVSGREATFALLKKEARYHHIVHFIGHGDILNGEAKLLLVNNSGNSDWCRIADVTQCLREQDVKLVCLNGCKTAAIGAFAHEFPAVLAMQFRISDEAAIAFAKGFYTELVQSGQLDCAVLAGRQKIHDAPAPRDRNEYLIPVLYMQEGDGHMFPLPKKHPERWALFAVLLVLAAWLFWPEVNADVRIFAQSGDKTAQTEYIPVPEAGGVLYSGDNFRIHVRLNRDAYVQLLLLDSTRAFDYLSPQRNEASRRSALAAGEEHVFPGPDSGFALDDNSGTETVFVLCARKPFEGLEKRVRQVNEYLETEDVSVTSAEIIEEIGNQLREQGIVVTIKRFEHQNR